MPVRACFLLLGLAACLGMPTQELEVSTRRSRTMQRHLRRLNKPAVRSIESPDGDVIDCVLLSQQPAFDHPKLRSHEIQMEPNFPSGMGRGAVGWEASGERLRQVWHGVGGGEGGCPRGTAPIRRTREEDLRRATSFQDYGRKFHPPPQVVPPPGTVNVLNENGHQHAIAYVGGGSYYGAKAVMNVWDPSIEVPSEFSLSQIWVLAGSFQGDLNSIEAGWQVSPDLYGDNNTRLFTYWTSDAYHATGCYNLLCSGFVQVSNEIAMGASISPVSAYSGKQYDVSILIWKDPKQGNWWMQFGDSYVLGYWPSELFSYLAESSSTIEWGGEVVNSSPGGQHTSTQMGSGYFPSEGFGRAAYFSNLQVVDAANNLMPPMDLSTFAENANCYDVQSGHDTNWGQYFYYGGPGYSENCSW